MNSPLRPPRPPRHPVPEYMRHVLLAAAAALLLTSCASTPIAPLPRPAADTQGEVIIFREYAFAAGGMGLKVGADDKVFAMLDNNEKVRASFPTGSHEYFVQARSAEATRLRIDIRKGATVCLRTSASSDTYLKVVVPVTLMLTGYHFYLSQIPCPPPEELAKYKDVEVSYQ